MNNWNDYGINIYDINETLFTLQNERHLKNRRLAAVKWVLDRLELEIDDDLKKLGLTEKHQQAFLDGAEPGCSEAAEIILTKLNLSREQKNHFTKHLKKGNRNLALCGVQEYLRTKKQTEFQKRAKLDAASWRRFLLADVLPREKNRTQALNDMIAGQNEDTWETFFTKEYLPTERNLEKICAGFGLDKKEEQTFLSLCIQRSFPINDALRNDLKEKLKPDFSREKGEHILYDTQAFMAHARLSEKVWNKFGIRTKEPKEEKKSKEPSETAPYTSQGTLLMLLIGLKMNEPTGKEFLWHVHSGFYLYRDLVVLSCIKNNVYNAVCSDAENYIDVFKKILDEFADSGDPDHPLYQNPYLYDA